MTTLPNFPMVSQLSTFTSDGLPNKDSPYECVAASIGAAILWYQGKSAWDTEVSPDRLKDAVYGESYEGGTSAIRYVPFVKSLGYTLAPINGTPGQLIGDIHALLASGIPVVITEADPYVPSSYGWTHCCTAFADTANTITVLDPYIGRPVTHSDTEWTDLLKDNQIWTVEKVEDMPVIIDLTTPGIGQYFELANSEGTQWRCRATGKIIQFGILDAYKGYGNSALCGLTYLGLPQSNEIPLPGIAGAVKQYFERGTLIYDPNHQNDNPPGAGAVYAAHLYTGPAQDPRVSQIAPLQSQIAALEAQIAQAQAGNPQAIAALQARINKAIADLS